MSSVNLPAEFPANLNAEAIDHEEIIPKINSIEDLESLSPYPNTDESYWSRLKRAVERTPNQYQFAALRIFASVVYLGERTLDDAWRFLFRELSTKFPLNRDNILEQAFVLAEDPANLKKFVHCNQIKGRLDADKHPRLSGIGDVIREIYLEKMQEKGGVHSPKGIVGISDRFLKREKWILLYDNALSGKSLVSELTKTRDLCSCLNIERKIIVLTQIITTDAMDRVRKAFGGDFDDSIFYAIHLDNRFKVNSDSWTLFGPQGTPAEVRELCESFFDDHLRNNPEYANTMAESDGKMAFGFMDSGLTIVTPNCPTNSIPLLWYQDPQNKYNGPYPRVESRLTQEKGRDSYYLNCLKELLGC